MGLEINRLVNDVDDEWVEAAERLCRTEDDRLVPESDPDARWLHCVPGQRIRRSELERFGIKADTGHEDKAVKAPEGDKDALLAEASALGIKVHPNAKADTIQRRIDEAREG